MIERIKARLQSAIDSTRNDDSYLQALEQAMSIIVEEEQNQGKSTNYMKQSEAAAKMQPVLDEQIEKLKADAAALWLTITIERG